jgi:uncharacterized repeat protein (TIGR03803 family)
MVSAKIHGSAFSLAIPSWEDAMKLRVSGLLAITACIAAVASNQLHAATLTTVVSFNGSNGASPVVSRLLVDANGNLFGTTFFGPYDDGTVFEIAKTAGGYATTPTTLVSFNATPGAGPYGGVIADADGNLLGTTAYGGVGTGEGTVFEIAKTASGYATTATTLVSSFNRATSGRLPFAGLVAYANGNLFGAANAGGANNDGTIFEVAKTAGGYASSPIIVVTFDGANGAFPVSLGSLIIDADGNLFGMTQGGGANNGGTVFEIAKTAGGYASAPTILYSFCAKTNCTEGTDPLGSLVAAPTATSSARPLMAVRITTVRCSKSRKPTKATAPPRR